MKNWQGLLVEGKKKKIDGAMYQMFDKKEEIKVISKIGSSDNCAISVLFVSH